MCLFVSADDCKSGHTFLCMSVFMCVHGGVCACVGGCQRLVSDILFSDSPHFLFKRRVSEPGVKLSHLARLTGTQLQGPA